MSAVRVEECKRVLECAIGEAPHVLPDDVIRATLWYLNEYKRLKNILTWDECPENVWENPTDECIVK